MAQFVERVCLGGGTAEVREAEGLEQVVHGIEFEAFDGVFGVGGREDDHGAVEEPADELHAVQVGHVDVHEDQVDLFRGEPLLSLDGVVEPCDEFQVGDFGDVGGDLAQSQGFVVDGDTLKHGESGFRG